jgi:transposase-like protein
MREEQVIGKRSRRRSRAEAEQLVDAFEASGLRRREFCLKHGVALGTLDLWRKRWRQERGTVASNRKAMLNVNARAKATSGGRLVAVELAGVPAIAVRSGLTVVVSRGWRIEVSPGFDGATLERLLGVLEQE